MVDKTIYVLLVLFLIIDLVSATQLPNALYVQTSIGIDTVALFLVISMYIQMNKY